LALAASRLQYKQLIISCLYCNRAVGKFVGHRAWPDWQVHYAFFARKGFTDAANAQAATVGALPVDLALLDADLRAEQAT